jgi:phosphonate transport system substrate-binding protein
LRHILRFCFLLLATAPGCRGRAEPAPAVVRVSALPDQAPDRVLAQHKAAVDEVCRIARLTCAWVQVPSYEALVDGLGRGDIDLAFLGGVTFAQARHRFGAIPLAMRDIDFAFTSVILVRADDSARGLADLRGRRFAFGNRSSTSGHYMPRYFLQRLGLVPERAFGSVTYSGGHDATMRLIADGQVDAGAVNGSLAYAVLAASDSTAPRLRVLWRSPPFTDYVWAARPGLAADVRGRLQNAFLDLDLTEPALRAALDHEGAGGYVPADPDEFDQIAEILRERGQL